MMSAKSRRIAYWAFTLLFLVPMAGSGIPELLVGAPASSAAMLTHLGYPLYLLRILGLAKVLGAVAILRGKSRRLTEWAYAGYTFDLLGAIASHLFVGDGAFALVPALALVFLSASLATSGTARTPSPA